jgi:imidazolonepropionase-like amidohydrolase
MPGLIDAHVHIFITKLPLAALEGMPLTFLAVSASVLMRGMLLRGFTSVRDTAGGDFGMKAACDDGLAEGPRLFISGMAMSQTGGHGDFRRRTQNTRLAGRTPAFCSGSVSLASWCLEPSRTSSWLTAIRFRILTCSNTGAGTSRRS